MVHVEVNEEADAFVAQFEIGKKLGVMDGEGL
jgi:hypothetical protein